MPPKTKDIDTKKLNQLATELVTIGALAGPVTTKSNRQIKGLAFLLKDLRSTDLKKILSRLDLTVPLSKDAVTTLGTLKQIIEENEKLKELSVTDNLTGLFNVRFFRDRLEVEIHRVSRTEKPCSLMMLDLDHFKPVNDQYGHQTGDQLLRDVASILRAQARVIDIPIRYGGDELAIILPDTGTWAGLRMAERLRKQIETDPRTAKYGVTTSIGLATHHSTDHEDTTALVERADQALYQAKRQGGNSIYVFESDRLKEKPTEVTVSERDDLFLRLPMEED